MGCQQNIRIQNVETERTEIKEITEQIKSEIENVETEREVVKEIIEELKSEIETHNADTEGANIRDMIEQAKSEIITAPNHDSDDTEIMSVQEALEKAKTILGESEVEELMADDSELLNDSMDTETEPDTDVTEPEIVTVKDILEQVENFLGTSEELDSSSEEAKNEDDENEPAVTVKDIIEQVETFLDTKIDVEKILKETTPESTEKEIPCESIDLNNTATMVFRTDDIVEKRLELNQGTNIINHNDEAFISADGLTCKFVLSEEYRILAYSTLLLYILLLIFNS